MATTADTLTTAINSLVAAAAAHAGAASPTTVHTFTANGFRMTFMGKQLQKMIRA